MRSKFGREPLRQPALGGFVAAALGFQYGRDFSRRPVDGSAFFPQAKKIYQTVAEFAEGFRLYQRTEDTLSE
jgi:hypothetical protein